MYPFGPTGRPRSGSASVEDHSARRYPFARRWARRGRRAVAKITRSAWQGGYYRHYSLAESPGIDHAAFSEL